MNASELVQYTTDAIFGLIFVAVLQRAIRQPRRSNVDALLLFGALAFIVASSLVSRALGLSASLLSFVLLGLLVGLPFLTLRLVDDVIPVPRRVLLTAFAGWIVLALAFVVLPRELLLPVFGVVVVYFFLYETYGAVVVFGAARRASGVARPRLLAIAAGTLLLGGAILVAGLGIFLPPVAIATNVLGLGCALAYYAGFSTPRYLRRAWQEPWLREFMTEALRLAVIAEVEPVARGLSKSVARVIGAETAAVALWDDAKQTLRFYVGDQEMVETGLDGAVMAPVFTEQRPMIKLASAETVRLSKLMREAGLVSAIGAPITWGGARYGVLAIYAARPPLFAEDDLEIVDLLARQIALVLRSHDLFTEVRTLNGELEHRVAEVNAANEELGSFAYAVSHDLRAPLRAIDGFSEILVQEKSDVLGEEGSDHLRRVRKAAQTMGQLIDDLLQLSRTGRAELHFAPVDLTALGRRIAAEHAERGPDRQVTFRAAEGLRAAGDESLLRIVLDNLIGNAWKFTRPVKDPVVELGVTNGTGPRAFYVRDNGVGFDETYKAKLFVPFQRLHSPREFEGTGIGLATVRRVVRRHGGDVWAESRPDAGATFYFTLPDAADPART